MGATKVPQVARIAEGTTGVNTLSALRVLPIVFLPGTMGTRLTDPTTGDLIWNPTGVPFTMFLGTNGPGKMAANVDRLADLTRPLVPDTTHRCIAGNGSKARAWERAADDARIVNFGHVIPDFYAEIVLALHRQLTPLLKDRGIAPRIYCCGYDWRVDNAISARGLADVVARAQSECGGEKVIIVAHSMGGLVSRYYCKNLGGEAKVSALFLLASPSLGAVDAYVTLKTGILATKMLFVLGFVYDAISNSRQNARAFIRKMPSVWQLLPSCGLSHASPKWASFDPSNTGWAQIANNPDAPIDAMSFSNVNNLGLFYLDMYTGFTDLADDASRSQASTMVSQALGFQNSLITGNGLADDPTLATYIHPTTYAVYCADNPGTPISATVTFGYRTVDPTATPPDRAVVYSTTTATVGAQGDQTVPTHSANPSPTTVPFKAPPLAVPGTEHQMLPGDARTITYVVKSIAALVGGS